MFLGSILILYKQIAYFHYHLFEDELLMEKVFGRMHHLFLSVKLDELDFGPISRQRFGILELRKKTVQYRLSREKVMTGM